MPFFLLQHILKSLKNVKEYSVVLHIKTFTKVFIIRLLILGTSQSREIKANKEAVCDRYCVTLPYRIDFLQYKMIDCRNNLYNIAGYLNSIRALLLL